MGSLCFQPSGFRGSSVQPRLMSQSSVEGNLGQGQPGSDLQRALTSQYQWNQRGVSIMAGGALVQVGIIIESNIIIMLSF